MKKIRLRLDELEVSSFDVLPAMTAFGTVRGNDEVEQANTLEYTKCNDPGCGSGTQQCVSCDPSYCNSQCQTCKNPVCTDNDVTCDPSYCDTKCPSCGICTMYEITCDPSYCKTDCPDCYVAG